MAEWEKDGADDDPGFGIRAGDGGDCGQHAGGQRALRGFNTGLGIFIAGVAVVAATDVGAFWMFHRLRALVDQYGWGNVPPEAVPPFDILEHWGRLIDLGAAVLYGTG